MTTQLAIPFTAEKVRIKRETKRDKVEQFFWRNIGKKFESWKLHLPENQGGFGSATRSRISEINRDVNARVVIRNEVVTTEDGTESSCYWSERRGITPFLKNYITEAQ